MLLLVPWLLPGQALRLPGQILKFLGLAPPIGLVGLTPSIGLMGLDATHAFLILPTMLEMSRIRNEHN